MSDDKPIVTIVTITYNLIKNNRKDFIIKNIKSVHNQTYKNIEHIIIDGASNDGTLELLKPYEKKGWIKIYSESDNGIYDAMNKGILKSTGEYIVCLNSDDFYYINNAVELEINKIKSDNADLCYANSYVINENDQNQNYIWKGKETFHPLFGTFANHQTLMVKKETLIEHGLFDLDLPTCADNVYMLDMVLKNKKITYLDETIIGFRNNGWSCTIQEQAAKDYLEHFYNTYGKQTGLTFDDCYQCNCKRYLYLSLQDIEKLGNKIVREDWKREYFEEYEKYKNENTNTDTNTDTNTNDTDTDTNSNTDTNTKTNKRTKKYILLGFIPIYKSVKDDYSTKRYILEIPYSSWQNKGEYIVTRTFFQIFKKKKSYMYSKYYFLGIQFWCKKKSKINILMDKVSDLQNQTQNLVNENNNLKSELKQNIQNLQNENNDLKNELQKNIQNLLNDNKNQKEELHKNIKNLQKDNEHLKSCINTLNAGFEIHKISKNTSKNIYIGSDTEVNICMITDNSYVIPTMVAMQSGIYNKSNNSTYIFHLIVNNVSEDYIEKFKLLENDTVKINIIQANLNKYNDVVRHTHVSETACLKFDLGNLLTIDKVLYLDGDIIIRKDLGELYNTDIENYYVAGVRDIGGELGQKFNERIGVNYYFNSGVMLLNLKKHREDNLSDLFVRTKLEHLDWPCMDQDVLNYVMSKNILWLNLIYNCMLPLFENPFYNYDIHKLNEFYGIEYKDKLQLEYDSVIIHFAGESESRPWKCKNGTYQELWDYYYSKTPFKGNILEYV